MNKFYIDENNGRQYYAYNYQDNKVSYIALNSQDISLLLTSIKEKSISQINDKEKYIEIFFGDAISIIIDNLKVFAIHHDSHDQYFETLYRKINKVEERERFKKEKISTRKVNRTKKRNLPTKQIIAGTLSFSIGLSLMSGLIAKEIQKENIKEINPSISYTITKDSKLGEEQPVDEKINLLFLNRTESNRVDENTSKLEETIHYFGNSISNYSLRYGIPYNLACAQITQERPNIKNGTCENICQITYSYFVGQVITVPIYNENGFTGNYDTFEVTKEMLDSPDGNIRVGLAYLRICIDRFDSLITGLFAYNQGESALGFACDYFGLEKEDYLGDENALKARDLINRYYEEKGKKHGDEHYLENVFSYLELTDRSVVLEYYLGNEKKTIEINNSLSYNNELSR